MVNTLYLCSTACIYIWHSLFLPSVPYYIEPKMFEYTITFRHHKVAVFPTLLLLGAIIVAFASLVIAAKSFPKEQLIVTIPTLMFVIVGCLYALWPFIEQVQTLPIFEMGASV